MSQIPYMRVGILASGSRGNATLFESDRTRVLVDAGINRKQLERRAALLGFHNALDAIVITHAHRDHVGHCLALAAFHDVPLYMSEATARATDCDEARVFSPREPFNIGDLVLSPLPLPHDAAQVALRISDGYSDATICTDLGEVPPSLPEFLAGSDILLIESNHDLQMLRDGPHPDFVKRRIASARGHLSNMQTHALLRAIAHTLKSVVLMHLSESNNNAPLALATALDALDGRPVALNSAHQDFALRIESHRRAPAQLRFAFAS